MEIHAEVFDVRQSVEEVLGTMRELVAKNGNQLMIEYAHNAGTMLSDPVKFRQILLNLISNSGKSPKTGILRFMYPAL